MTLRTRLTAILVAVTAAGLLVAGVATFSALRSSLIDRLDGQLEDAIVPTARIVVGESQFGPGGPPSGPDADDQSLPLGAYAGHFSADGQAIQHISVPMIDGSQPSPDLRAEDVVEAAATGVSFDAPSTEGGTPYRVLVGRLQDGSLVAIAFPMTEVRATLARLVLIELVVSLIVLAAVALLSRWTVRRGLKPLEHIEETAEAIADGDLSQRVEDDDPATEVGRLGGSLNVMLGQIETAMDEQRASEEALRRFLADASHELRTPLTSIRGYAELFRRGAEDDPADTALAMRRIEQESERMGILVDDLLFLARSGRDRPIASEPVDLVHIAGDAVADARAVAPERSIRLEAPDEAILTGDERRLRQVAANLLSNAVVHTPADSPIEVRVEATAEAVEMTVSDRGPGLTPDQAAHVFDPFYRADEARERVHAGRDAPAEGTGLGLAIVAAIADAHGGGVTITTNPGEGASFTLRLPRSPSPVPVREPEPLDR